MNEMDSKKRNFSKLRFQLNSKRALPFCFLALAVWQFPCLAQSNSKTVSQFVSAEDMQGAPETINDFVETTSAGDKPFAFTDLSWLNDIFTTEESPTDSTAFMLESAATAVSSSSLGNTNPQNTAQSANGQTSGINKNYVLRGNFF